MKKQEYMGIILEVSYHTETQDLSTLLLWPLSTFSFLNNTGHVHNKKKIFFAYKE